MRASCVNFHLIAITIATFCVQFADCSILFLRGDYELCAESGCRRRYNSFIISLNKDLTLWAEKLDAINLKRLAN